jgi:hypothetical protein
MRVRLHPVMGVLGLLALLVSAWGLYTAMTTMGGAPGWVGVLSVAVMELFAVGLAIHAVHVARDGDSPAPFNTGIVLIAVLAATVQFSAAVSEGKGVLVGAVLALAPIAAITLWVVEVRRFFRLQGRLAGTVAAPAATIEPALWLRFPKAAWEAKRYALLDRTLGAKDALLLGLQATTQPPKQIDPPVRIDRGLTAEQVLPEMRSIPATAPAPETAALNGHTR